MSLSNQQLGKLRRCIQKKSNEMRKSMYWTYIKKIRISTSHKTYYYIGSTDDKICREYCHKSKSKQNLNELNLTSVERFLIQNRDIITFNKTEYKLYFYDDVDKNVRKTVKTNKEQLLLDECKLEAINDNSIIILNQRNVIALNPQPLECKIWKSIPYVCPCGFIKIGTNYSCKNANKYQHSKQNYTHLQWLRTQPPQNIEN